MRLRYGNMDIGRSGFLQQLYDQKNLKKEYYGKIIDIDEEVSIWTDKDQYIVKHGKQNSYFGSLEHCFNDICENQVKIRLIENSEKNIKRIIEIHKETSEWLKNIFRNLETPRFQ